MGPDVRQYFTQMMDFLSTYHLQGLVLGLCAFLIIGICHPIVIKGEYHYGQPFKWVKLCSNDMILSSTHTAIQALL